MNKQVKLNPDGSIKSRGIEWCDFTWNPIKGCFHACQWEMPDGTIANCYAEDIADRVAQKAYPHGFEHHYYDPEELKRLGRLKGSAKVFAGSMADNFGHWVPEGQINAIITECWGNPQHKVQFLTKNLVRVKQFDIPTNCWIGASVPPTFMWNKRLSLKQQEALLIRTLKTFSEVREYFSGVLWMSIEPLSFDIAPYLDQYGVDLNWVVIGAASNGRTYYQPKREWVDRILEWADHQGVAVFFKGNLEMPQNLWREDFPI